MRTSIAYILIVIALHLSASAYYIIPLRAGTLQVTDSDFRKDKVIRKLIDLKLTKTQYEAHKDTNVIASITSLSMNENMNFHFGYEIICPKEQCSLNFTLVRYTEKISEEFSYNIVVDYLVARGLITYELNMTFFQEHVYLKNVVSYDMDNVKKDLSLDLPYNNEDAWHMLLFPSGFNNLTLTGHIVYSYLIGTDTYVVHFMDHTGGHGEHDSMGWPVNKNYIRFTAVFIPDDYLEYADCTPVQEFSLDQHSEFTCQGGSAVKWFVGFKGTKETQIQGQLFELRAGFSYSLATVPSAYGLVAFPFKTNEHFIDLRVHEYKWEVEYRMIGILAGYVIVIAAIVGFLTIVFVFLRRYLRRTKKIKTVGKYDQMQEEAEHEGEVAESPIDH